MKKLIPILLALCLMVAPMTANVFADDHNQSVTASTMDETTNPDVVFLAGTVPADSELTDAILLPIHALVLSMWEHEQRYDIQSPDFIWAGLYYALSMYGQADGRTQLTQDALLLPSESVHDFAHALFALAEKLPPIPSGLTELIRFETASDTYRLSLGDFAETRLQPGKLTPQTDGLYIFDGTLTALEDTSPLCSFQVTLLENDSMFGFSILDVSLT